MSVRRILIEIGRFCHFSLLGFSLMLPMLGAATVSRAVAGWQLAAAAVAFHIFGYVSNDVFDLEIDRTQPLRSASPLVRGTIHPSVALAIALVPVPLVCAIHLWAGGAPAASAVLLAGMLLGLIYNRYGKRIAFPPLSDAVQGMAWVALAAYGALATGEPLRPPFVWLAATILVYVMLINGVVGALRDLANDAAHGARTTALCLGARATDDGRVVASPAVVRYGLGLQVLLLLLAMACFVREWRGHAVWLPVILAALAAGHAMLLRHARAALRAAARADVIRAGTAYLFLSIGVICLPFALFTNAFGASVIIASYAVPLSILMFRMGWSSMSTRTRATAALVILLALASPVASAQPTQNARVVSRKDLIRIMKAEDARYEIEKTPNGARFNAAVILALVREAARHDPQRTPLVIDHVDFYEAFLAVTGMPPGKAPAFIQKAHDHRETQYIDYRSERVIRKVNKGRQPELAVNVITGWTGSPDRYSYEDRDSDPPLRVTRERTVTYRLLDFGDRILFDDIHGLSGRALGGLLGLIFKVIGDGYAVRSFYAVAPDQTQVTLTTGRKGPIVITTTATVEKSGRGEKGVPKGRKDLSRLEETLTKPFEATYVPIVKTEPFQWTRIAANSATQPLI